MPTLTEVQREAVSTSWAVMATDMKGNGVALLLRLFADYPHYKGYFKKANLQDLGQEELASSPILKAIGSSMLSQLGSLVNCLDDRDCLTEMWRVILRKHVFRDITTLEPYENLLCTLLKVLEDTLGKAGLFDSQTKEAWEVVEVIMLDTIRATLPDVVSA